MTFEHGRYVVQMCAGGRALALGEGSVMPRYKDAGAFVAMMRSGKRADGSAIAVMPFDSLKTLSDTDLRALYLDLAQPTAP